MSKQNCCLQVCHVILLFSYRWLLNPSNFSWTAATTFKHCGFYVLTSFKNKFYWQERIVLVGLPKVLWRTLWFAKVLKPHLFWIKLFKLSASMNPLPPNCQLLHNVVLCNVMQFSSVQLLQQILGCQRHLKNGAAQPRLN